jgi:hypothetical protein
MNLLYILKLYFISSLPAKLTRFLKDFRREDVKVSVCSSSYSNAVAED